MGKKKARNQNKPANLSKPMTLAVKKIVKGASETKYQEIYNTFSFPNIFYTSLVMNSLPILGIAFNGSATPSLGVDASMLTGAGEGEFVGLKIKPTKLTYEGYLYCPYGIAQFSEKVPKYARMIIYRHKLSQYPIGEDANTAVTTNKPSHFFRSTGGTTSAPTGLINDMFSIEMSLYFIMIKYIN